MWSVSLALAFALAPAPDCGQPDTPPNPRCGEALDGRQPAPEAGSPAARAVLAVPGAGAHLVLLPVIKTSEVVEKYDVPGHLRAVLTTDDGLVGARPELTYTSGFIPSAGLRLFYGRLPGASFATTRFLTAGQNVLLGEVSLRGPPRTGLDLAASWSRRRDRLYAGIGPASEAELAAMGRGIARYAADIGRLGLRWTSPRERVIRLDAGSDFEWRNYDGNDVRNGPPVTALFGAPADACAASGVAAPCVDPLLVPGFDIGRRLLRQRARLALDLRDHQRDGDGVEVAFDATYGRGIMGDPSQLVRLGFDTVGAIGGHDRALVLRGQAAVVQPLAGTVVPFDEMISAAGINTMRGFPEGRFRDRSAVVGTVEWRWLVAARIDASLFSDVGAVAGPWFADLRRSSLYTSVGAGLRLYELAQPQHWQAGGAWGAQVAYSPESGVRLMVSAAAF